MADHLGKRDFLYFQIVSLQDLPAESGAFGLHDRRELRHVAHQDQPAVLAGVDILDQVVQQTSRSEDERVQPVVGDHGGFVNDE